MVYITVIDVRRKTIDYFMFCSKEKHNNEIKEGVPNEIYNQKSKSME